jgi:hypothetical protein
MNDECEYECFADVWSYGVVMWEIYSFGTVGLILFHYFGVLMYDFVFFFFFKIPYTGFSNKEAVEKVLEGYRLHCPKGCPKGVYALMLQIWNADVDARPSFEAVSESLHQLTTSAGKQSSQLYVRKASMVNTSQQIPLSADNAQDASLYMA